MALSIIHDIRCHDTYSNNGHSGPTLKLKLIKKRSGDNSNFSLRYYHNASGLGHVEILLNRLSTVKEIPSRCFCHEILGTLNGRRSLSSFD